MLVCTAGDDSTCDATTPKHSIMRISVCSDTAVWKMPKCSMWTGSNSTTAIAGNSAGLLTTATLHACFIEQSLASIVVVSDEAKMSASSMRSLMRDVPARCP